MSISLQPTTALYIHLNPTNYCSIYPSHYKQLLLYISISIQPTTALISISLQTTTALYIHLTPNNYCSIYPSHSKQLLLYISISLQPITALYIHLTPTNYCSIYIHLTPTNYCSIYPSHSNQLLLYMSISLQPTTALISAAKSHLIRYNNFDISVIFGNCKIQFDFSEAAHNCFLPTINKYYSEWYKITPLPSEDGGLWIRTHDISPIQSHNWSDF